METSFFAQWKASLLEQPPDPSVLYFLGKEFLRLGRYASAGRYLNRSLCFDPSQKETHRLLNEILVELDPAFHFPQKLGSFLCCDSQGNYVATGGSGKDPIILWDFWERKALKSFPNPGGFIRAMSFSPCGQFLAVGGNDHQVRVLSLYSPDAELRVVGSHENFVISLGFNATHLFSAGQDGRVLRFALGKGGEIGGAEEVFRHPLFNALSVQGDFLYLAGHGIYRGEQTELRFEILPQSSQSLFFCVDSFKEGILAGEGDSSRESHLRYLWVFHQELFKIPAHSAMIKSVQVNRNQRYILSSAFDGTTKLFDFQQRREIAVYPALMTGMSRFHPNADVFIHFGEHGDLEVHPLPME